MELCVRISLFISLNKYLSNYIPSSFKENVSKTKHFFLRGSDWTKYDPICYFIPQKGLFRSPSKKGWNWDNYIEEKKKGEIRIICLGDSTTYGNWVNHEESYPYLLEQLLKKEYPEKNIKVLNAGLPGASSQQIKRFFQLYLARYKPDIVIWRKDSELTDTYKIQKLTSIDSAIRNFIWSGLYHLRIFRVIAIINDQFRSDNQTEIPPTLDRTYNYIMGMKQDHRNNYNNDYKSNFCIVKEICKKNGIKYTLAVDYLQKDFNNELTSDYRKYNNKKIRPLVTTFDIFKQKIDQTSIGEIFIDDCHLTKIGIQILAKEVFNFLIDNNWINNLPLITSSGEISLMATH